MNDCLITRLKSKVDSDDIIELGAIKIRFNYRNGNIRKLNLGNGMSRKSWARILTQGVNFCTSDGIDLGVNYLNFENETGNIYLPGTPNHVDVICGNKYSFTVFAGSSDCFVVNIDDLKYSPLITLIEASRTGTTGDISSLSGMPNLRTFTSYESKVTGNISVFENLTKIITIKITKNNTVTGDLMSLSNCLNLTETQFYDTNVTGNICQLVKAQIANGRTSCDRWNFETLYNYNKIVIGGPYQDALPVHLLQFYISWADNVLTLHNTGQADYDGITIDLTQY